MSVKKVVAKTSRAALKAVREQLGAEAVILSSRETSEGVEMLAVAQDDLVVLVNPKAESPKVTAKAPFAAAATQRVAAPRPATQGAPTPLAAVMPVSPRAERVAPAAKVEPARFPTVDAGLLAEIKSMRGMLEQQLANSAWDETQKRKPLRLKLLQSILAAGFSPALGRYLTERLPDDYSHSQGESWIQSALGKSLHCVASSHNLVDRGGVYALVGPTGVGKTTTAAKLASRCVVKYGASKLGLISTDTYRIGAQDQLRIYGKILGVPVHAVQDEMSLQAVLAGMRDKHLVLIDTTGVPQRDARLAEQMALFTGTEVQRVLLLSAAAQTETLEDVVQAYQGRGLYGAILTKIDEAAKIGGALDVAIRHRLAVQFVTNGQRVPEDLHSPNVGYLVHSAFKAATRPMFALREEEYRAFAASIMAPLAILGEQRHA